ncbi:MAG: DNA recombination protein RmuC [Clostridia bacterium]|jgi:DNA recombination protein RmuC|nr:DNA recombination protein RmuC [Clostridia bacterium]MBT7121501.1 DNA recombination protein RmuC [Clostridia bacterium]
MNEILYIIAGVILVVLIAVLILVIVSAKRRTNIDYTLTKLSRDLNKQLADMTRISGDNAYQLRREVIGMFNTLGENSTKTLSMTTKNNSESMEKLRFAVEQKLKELSESNEKRLEQIRKTVDDQLSDMLEKKLTGSFKLVSDQLEQVFKSMGEVKSLATGVGDLKRVLTNVKVRGTWGEMQLGNLISTMLSPVQYVTNVQTGDSRENVEFAIILPGNGEDKVLLPIDSKFPMEDFIRKENVIANTGDKAQIDEATKILGQRMIFEAKRISEKYINPPVTTDFAIMYLPTEGLYADAISLGISDVCQRKHNVTIAGPSTLTALLNSLQMGFRTLAIEQQSSEVLKLLESTRKAFGNFSIAIDKTKKSLNAAQNNLDDASRKSRTIERQLNKVDGFELEPPEE